MQVLIDPRLQESQVTLEDLIAQEDLSLKIRDLQTRAKQLAHTVAGHTKRLVESKNIEDSEKEIAALKAIEAQLSTAEGRYQQPMLLAQINYLAYMLNAADQRPGKDAYERYAVLKEQLESLIVNVQQSSSD